MAAGDPQSTGRDLVDQVFRRRILAATPTKQGARNPARVEMRLGLSQVGSELRSAKFLHRSMPFSTPILGAAAAVRRASIRSRSNFGTARPDSRRIPHATPGGRLVQQRPRHNTIQAQPLPKAHRLRKLAPRAPSIGEMSVGSTSRHGAAPAGRLSPHRPRRMRERLPRHCGAFRNEVCVIRYRSLARRARGFCCCFH